MAEDPYSGERCENKKRLQRSVRTLLFVRARGGRYALHKGRARNLYKQSSGHNGSPAKHWVSHHPQLTTHKHKCANTQTLRGSRDKVRKQCKRERKHRNIRADKKDAHKKKGEKAHGQTRWQTDLRTRIPLHYNYARLSRSQVNHCQSGSKLNMKPHLPLSL